MLRNTIVLAFAISLAFGALANVTHAEQCRDAKGKFIACPKPAPEATKCRDITTKKFAKCGAPNTEAVPVVKSKSNITNN